MTAKLFEIADNHEGKNEASRALVLTYTVEVIMAPTRWPEKNGQVAIAGKGYRGRFFFFFFSHDSIMFIPLGCRQSFDLASDNRVVLGEHNA